MCVGDMIDEVLLECPSDSGATTIVDLWPSDGAVSDRFPTDAGDRAQERGRPEGRPGYEWEAAYSIDISVSVHRHGIQYLGHPCRRFAVYCGLLGGLPKVRINLGLEIRCLIQR